MEQILMAWVVLSGAWHQDWYGSPRMPGVFAQEQAAPFRNPDPTGPSRVPAAEERSSFPSLREAVDFDEWKRKDDQLRLREWAGEATFKVPLLIPQLILEELIPRGLAVGPTTFLYKSSSSSMSLVVLDQALCHEAEFLERLQALGADNPYYADTLTRGQRLVLRRSLMNGFRATYSLPTMTLNLILETTAEQGAFGYVLTPAAAGALVCLKGLDQRFSVDDVLKGRVQLASGRDWVRAVHGSEGRPTISLELQFFELPLSLIGSFEASTRGMAPAFVGVGTSLDVVEDLLGREANRRRRPEEQ